MGRSSQVRRRVGCPGRGTAYPVGMAAPEEPRIEPPTAPPEFRRAVTQVRAARIRAELLVEEMPAPQRIAPFASALSADVTVDGDEVGPGRWCVLHDPDGNDAWEGTFRCVAYVRAEIDPELVSDPLLAGVGWSWLTEASRPTARSTPCPRAASPASASESFGGMADEPLTAQLEVRASWTPVGDLTAHVEAWGDLLCTAAGLPPVPEGVATMPSSGADSVAPADGGGEPEPSRRTTRSPRPR